MNLEDIKDYIIYSTISGSHSYGLNTERSDVDIRGIFLLPTRSVLSGREDYVEQVSDEKNDIVYYELGRFIELAMVGNPNILELFNVDEKNVRYKHPIMDEILAMKYIFITKKLSKTFVGYAHSQIKKARGLNKKINSDKDVMTRKDASDFCYVHRSREESINLKKYFDITGFSEDRILLASVNNYPDCYSMYFTTDRNGRMFGKDRNMIKLSSIPKFVAETGYLTTMRFDKNAYSQHCKAYREYKIWEKNRNPERYKDNISHGEDYDTKNMMHTFRLLHMAKDIAEGKGIVVNRKEDREYLMKIRNAEMTYDYLLSKGEELIEQINLLFEQSDLPDEISQDHIDLIKDKLVDVRMNTFDLAKDKKYELIHSANNSLKKDLGSL